MGDNEDSFEDFLEWRKWKKEKSQGNSIPMIEASREAKAPVVKQAPAPVFVAQAAQPQEAAIKSKGKEEVPRALVVPAAVPVQIKSVETNGQKVAVPAQEGAGGGPGGKFLADLASANEKGKKELRGLVLDETREFLKAGKYPSEGVIVELDVVGAAVGRTVFRSDHKFGAIVTPYNTTAHFVKSDALDTALFLIERKGVNPFLVVPVDPKNLGGGFPGSASLEEQLYRRSTALSAVGVDFNYDIPPVGGVYLPSVQVFRENEAKGGYQLLKAPRKVAVLLTSSVEKPKYEFKGKDVVLDAEAKQALINKVTAILHIGLEQGHDAIVVSAFGCGFNQTPPQAVAAVFRDLLTQQFSNAYKHVTFAIQEDENCLKPHNPAGNLLPFQEEFLAIVQKADVAEKKGCCGKGGSAKEPKEVQKANKEAEKAK